MLTTKKKKAVVKSTARHDADTGSPDVQVALLSKQIDELAKHLKKNPKDFHSLAAAFSRWLPTAGLICAISRI